MSLKKAAYMLNIHICQSLGQLVKCCYQDNTRVCPQLFSCNMQVLSTLDLCSFSWLSTNYTYCLSMMPWATKWTHVFYSAHSSPFQANIPKTAVQLTGLGESSYTRQSYSNVQPCHSCGWMLVEKSAGLTKSLEETGVTEGLQLQWALGCSGQ